MFTGQPCEFMYDFIHAFYTVFCNVQPNVDIKYGIKTDSGFHPVLHSRVEFIVCDHMIPVVPILLTYLPPT